VADEDDEHCELDEEEVSMKCDDRPTHINRYAHMRAGLRHHSSLSSPCRAVPTMVARRAWKCRLTIEAVAAAEVAEFAV
jgi:hypothetical protein